MQLMGEERDTNDSEFKVVVRSGLTRHGPIPSSYIRSSAEHYHEDKRDGEPFNNPISESDPGPPFNHSVIGAVSASFLASKNQKNRCRPSSRSTYPEYDRTPCVVSQIFGSLKRKRTVSVTLSSVKRSSARFSNVSSRMLLRRAAGSLGPRCQVMLSAASAPMMTRRIGSRRRDRRHIKT